LSLKYHRARYRPECRYFENQGDYDLTGIDVNSAKGKGLFPLPLDERRTNTEPGAVATGFNSPWIQQTEVGGYDHTAGNGQVSFCIRNVYYLRTIPHSVELAIMMCKRSIRIIALVLTLLVSGAAVLSWDVAYEQQITDSFLEPPNPLDNF